MVGSGVPGGVRDEHQGEDRGHGHPDGTGGEEGRVEELFAAAGGQAAEDGDGEDEGSSGLQRRRGNEQGGQRPFIGEGLGDSTQ